MPDFYDVEANLVIHSLSIGKLGGAIPDRLLMLPPGLDGQPPPGLDRIDPKEDPPRYRKSLPMTPEELAAYRALVPPKFRGYLPAKPRKPWPMTPAERESVDRGRPDPTGGV